MPDRLAEIRARLDAGRRVWWRYAEVYGFMPIAGGRTVIPRVAEQVMSDTEWLVGEVELLRDSLRWAADTHDAGELSPQGLRELLTDLGIERESENA